MSRYGNLEKSLSEHYEYAKGDKTRARSRIVRIEDERNKGAAGVFLRMARLFARKSL